MACNGIRGEERAPGPVRAGVGQRLEARAPQGDGGRVHRRAALRRRSGADARGRTGDGRALLEPRSAPLDKKHKNDWRWKINSSLEEK
jgi:hypothetical protein